MKDQKPPSTPSNQPPSKPKNEGYGNYGTYGDYGSYGGYGNYGAGGAGGYGGGPGGYGPYGGYSGYYYGYGYGGYGGYQQGGEPAQSRSIRDYLVILRERIWYMLLTFFVIFGAFILYLVNATPLYEATASLEVLKAPSSAGLATPMDSSEVMGGAEDFNTRVRLMESRVIAENVFARMTDDEKKQFMAPYLGKSLLQGDTSSMVDRLMQARSAQQGRLTYVMQISVDHPNAQLAAKIADYFADEFINYNKQLNTQRSLTSVEQLIQQEDEQSKKVSSIQSKMDALVDKYGLPNLDPKNNMMPARMININGIVGTDQNEYDVLNEHYNQILEYKAANKPLWELSFIAANGHVNELRTAYDSLKQELVGLHVRFGDKHPDIIDKTLQLQQLETALQAAVNTAADTVASDRDAAQRNLDSAHQELDALQKEMHDLSNVQNDYDRYNSEKESAYAMEVEMQHAIDTQRTKVILEGTGYQLMDSATGQMVQKEPRTTLLITGGLVVGLMSGVAVAFLVAFLDDRIKSAFDIESYVGLPLIGILPRIAHLSALEKAQAVASNADRRITEAFRSIYSSLKLNDASKNARVILVTSTVPSEGKSFMTTNLALTYAMHAERVLLIDCDLRMPNIARSLGKEDHEQGLMTHLQEGRPLEECLVKDFYPGLDILPTGGRTQNPTQIFNGREFADFITRMRQQYDRVFIDSPPLGAVSDALNLLPNVDGIIYVIKFNAVKRKVAKINLSRLMQGNVPIFGAVLNQISLASASYYYTHYYDKSYRNYYMHDEDQKDQNPSPGITAAAADHSDAEKKS